MMSANLGVAEKLFRTEGDVTKSHGSKFKRAGLNIETFISSVLLSTFKIQFNYQH